MRETTLSPAAAAAAAGVSLTPSPLTRREQAYFHMAMLNHPNGYIEIRYRHEDRMRQTFFTDPADATAKALTLSDTTDVYLGVLPRLSESGGAAAVTTHSRVLWCDCDNEMAVERAMSFEHRPHFAVQSSPGRAHFYWLIQSLPTDLVAQANKRLAFHFGGDLRCTDPARILRVAGTQNWKRGEPVPVVLTWAKGFREYQSKTLVGHLPDPAAPKVKVPRNPTRRFDDPSKDALLSVRSPIYAERLTGREVSRTGMIQCPFHKGGQESTPSLHVGGPQDTLWHCFGCDEGGDIFTLAEKLWGESEFPKLVKRLQEIF